MSVQQEATKAGFQAGHVGLNVTDLERSKAFYRQVFGFELQGGSAEAEQLYAFLGTGDRTFVTLWQQSGGRFERGRPGLHHLSFQVQSADELRQVEARLRELGAALLYDGIVPHATGASSAAVFFEDPDGIRLEVYSPQGVEAATVAGPAAPACGFF